MVLLSSTDMSSYRVIKETLVLFGDLTGLKLNCSKSKIFFGSTPRVVREALCGYMEMFQGVLPVKSVSFSHDKWSSMGLVCDCLSVQERPNVHLSSDVSLRDALPLKLSSSRRQTTVLLRLVSEASLVSFFYGRDRWVWNCFVDGRFTQRSLWEEVRPRSAKLTWTKWLWARSDIPRQEFVTWMLFHWKLPTRDRLLRLEYRGSHVWWSERQWCIDNLGGKSLKRRLMQVAFMCTVYTVWQERNSRVFGGSSVSADVLYHKIVSIMHDRACSWRGVKRTKANWEISLDWSLSHNIFLPS
ncbi:hypothetical protein LIER_35623 [Lithospermum erythrorhizon]|uniref:Reverse transcriptase zinc-binding domain-containing protein n=1 Tax=Lithospermum erythrorhizon TaxID=34254 RepID=A0AAV3NU19_LITER